MSTITTDAELLEEVEQFCATNEMRPTTFGRMAVGDGSLVPNLRSGRSPTAKLANRIINFMVTYRPPQAEAA